MSDFPPSASSSSGGASPVVQRTVPVRPPTPEQVRHYLRCILLSAAFDGSTKGRDLLKSTVEACLNGKQSEIHEHLLAAKYFPPGKKGFDSKAFYKMRAVLKRMRGRLKAYYRDEGKLDEVIIEYGRGLYLPRFYFRTVGHVGVPETAAWENDPESEVDEELDAPHAEEAGEGENSPALAELIARSELRRRPKKGHRGTWVIAMAVIGLVGLGIAATLIMLNDRAALSFGPATKITGEGELGVDPSLSANGKFLVYSSDKDTAGHLNIWMRNLDDSSSKRLTHGDFDESQPSISPDGRTLAYRSEQDGGGIYVVSTAGGTPKLIAAEGRDPRISPDGQMVMYWVAGDVPNSSKLYLAPLGGGTPRQLAKGFPLAQTAVWSPDGKYILFAGHKGEEGNDAKTLAPDWWVMPLDESRYYQTRALNVGALHSQPYSWGEGNRITFDLFEGGTRVVREVKLDPDSNFRAGPPRAVGGTATGEGQAVLAAGRLVRGDFKQEAQIGWLPTGPADQSRPSQLIARSGQGNEYAPSVSHDGRYLALMAESRPDALPIIRDLIERRDIPATASPSAWSPTVSGDGRHSAVLFYNAAASQGGVEVRGPDGKTRAAGCERCERIVGLSSDGQRVMYQARNPQNPPWIGIVDVATGKNATLIGYPNIVLSSTWSPDGRFVVFSSRGADGQFRLMLSRLTGETASKPEVLSSGKHIDDKPRFSADGKTLYFLSSRDRFFCLYSASFDPATGRLVGQPAPVRHFHRRNFAADSVTSGRQDLAVSRDRVFLVLSKLSSTILLSEAR